MARYTVIYDACVLYPAPLRDLLVSLALTDLFNAKWTDKIHAEWIENLLKKRQDLTRAKLDRTRELMDRHVREPKVDNYEDLIPRLENIIPDKNDAHVIAAAIKSNSDAIITFNLKDFPRSVLDTYHIEVIHPDDFIHYQIDLDAAKVCQAIKKQRLRLRKPPKAIDEYLSILQKQSLPKTVLALKNYSSLL